MTLYCLYYERNFNSQYDIFQIRRSHKYMLINVYVIINSYKVTFAFVSRLINTFHHKILNIARVFQLFQINQLSYYRFQLEEGRMYSDIRKTKTL